MSALLFSCNDNVNNWSVDSNYDGLFRSLTFSVGKLKPTTVAINYSKVIGATKYIFEFSKDSLLFNNICRRDTLLADTLTSIGNATDTMSIKYQVVFKDLDGLTQYSIRMKGISDKKQSGYVSAAFKTPKEQIFTGVTSYLNSATFTWPSGENVTTIRYWKTDVNNSDTTEVKLSSDQITNGSATISGLTSGESYGAALMKGMVMRGLASFTTKGIYGARVVTVNSTQAFMDSLNYYNGIEKNMTFVFEGGTTYELGRLTIPANYEKILFYGDTSSGSYPVIHMANIGLIGNPSLIFNYVTIDAQMDPANYMFNIGNTYCFNNLTFDGCNIKNIGRSLIRLTTAGLTIGSINISNCTISNIGKGGYGMINISKPESIGKISITSSTLIDLGEQMLQTNDGVGSIIVNKCTFYNNSLAMNQIFKFDKQPTSILVTNSIFSGPNNGAKVNSGYNNYSTFLLFNLCYQTSDFVTNANAFTNISSYSGTSNDLFVDPINGDFHIKSGASFAGRGVAGDPRWY